ncbi:alpha/beta hydrolase fold [Agreia bicolorata]|uniref:Alpha/beta hydrolase fold n=2 Tax=Agreia bicolorata TaxID=110935 RepID=A0A1T4XM47_9MICO|nr:alpha/beta hydrolase fold [Agreia bicolorata]
MNMTRPHLSGEIRERSRRGGFWMPGQKVTGEAGTLLRGSTWVEWESPVDPLADPVVFVHGGGGQGTDWLTTPDGRPGWAAEFVAAGHPVYVVDRPGHGRSRSHPDLDGPLTGSMPLEAVARVFASSVGQGDEAGLDGIHDLVLHQLGASAGPRHRDLAEGNRRDADRLVELLEMIGPAIIVSHSLGALGSWVAASRRPRLVSALVAVEPPGPPFSTIPGVGRLDSGLAAIDPADVDTTVDDAWARSLSGVPIAVVTAPESPFRDGASRLAGYLVALGLDAEEQALEQHGLQGNGHGLILESNSSSTAAVVLEWIATRRGHASL